MNLPLILFDKGLEPNMSGSWATKRPDDALTGGTPSITSSVLTVTLTGVAAVTGESGTVNGIYISAPATTAYTNMKVSIKCDRSGAKWSAASFTGSGFNQSGSFNDVGVSDYITSSQTYSKTSTSDNNEILVSGVEVGDVIDIQYYKTT